MAEELRSGYTTGTCAAVGTKAALEYLLYGKINFTRYSISNV